MFIYLLTGAYQKQRVENIVSILADERGHEVEKMFVHPSPGNTVLWRTIYQTEGRFYVDAVRAGVFSEEKLYEGAGLDRFELNNYRT